MSPGVWWTSDRCGPMRSPETLSNSGYMVATRLQVWRRKLRRLTYTTRVRQDSKNLHETHEHRKELNRLVYENASGCTFSGLSRSPQLRGPAFIALAVAERTLDKVATRRYRDSCLHRASVWRRASEPGR